MANKNMSAAFQNVEDAEKVIQSYAYGEELDLAIEYLQKNDPQNAVLATIKDFNNDRMMLKSLNALYRADQARAENDTEELRKIAEFLNVSENEDLRKEALKMISELPEVKNNPELPEAVDEMLEQAGDAPKKLPVEEKTMSDDEIVANAGNIAGMMDENFEMYVLENAVKPAQAKVSVTDDAGEVVDEETSDNLWLAKMRAAMHEVSMHHMDDAKFAAQDKDSQLATLKKDAVDVFWIDLYGIVGASAEDPSASAEENKKRNDEAVNQFKQGKHSTAKADHILNSVVATGENMKLKAASFTEQKKSKAASWMNRAYTKFNKFLNDYIGTKAEVKQAAIGYFSTARGVTNTAATLGLIGASMISLPAALAAAATYGIYQSQSWRWKILEKRNANLALAKASGNAKEIKIWEGPNGLKNAYNAIQASPREKARFDIQKRMNLRAGWASAAVVAAATPFVLSGGVAALGLGALATWGVARFAASGARVAGANANAYLQMKEAIKEDKEDQTTESKKAANRAKGALGLSLLFSGFAEYLMASSVADHVAGSQALGVVQNPDHVAAADSLDHTQEGQIVDNSGNDAPDATPETTNVTVPDEWNASMGITEKQWNEMHDKFTGIFKNRADIFGMDNKQPNLTWQNMYNNIEHAKAAGALPDNMTDEQIMYKYMKLVENTERAEVVPGTHGKYLRSVLDADKQPMYWVDQEQMRALNDIILCGKEVSVSADVLGKSLARITDNGVYVGEGAGIGQTHNRFVGFGRGEDCPDGTNNVNAWERVKGVFKRVIGKTDATVEEQVVVEEPVKQDGVVTSDVVVEDKKLPDGNADDGASVETKYQKVTTDSNKGQFEEDSHSIARNRYKGQGFIPNSRVNAGPEI